MKDQLVETVNPDYNLCMWNASTSRKLLADPAQSRIHLIGAKGTGMCALAEILVARGAHVSGSDTSETFYTDRILDELGVKVSTFDQSRLPADIDLVICSAAYDESNTHVAAAGNHGLPILTYPEALGCLSDSYMAIAIAGVHGKTTTTAMAGTLVKELHLPATVVVGSAVAGFGNRSTWQEGNEVLIAETCEYRRHFLHYHPQRIILTNVESDHQDYYPDYSSIKTAFMEFTESLPQNGELIYCQDDGGAREVAETLSIKRPDVTLTSYGETAVGLWAVKFLESTPGRNRFRLAAFDIDFDLAIPGKHIALDAAAALALVSSLTPDLDVSTAADALTGFQGSRRRSEIIGESNGILVMDDYAHHPTAIRATLKGLKEFYPDRRLVVDFMPHTYSRTAALMDDFANCFQHADILCLHPIYASARESNTSNVSGKELARRTAERRGNKTTVYHSDFDQSCLFFKNQLCPGDLFITLGAGNNWTIGRQLFEAINR